MENGTIVTRMSPDPGVFTVLAEFGTRVEAKLLGFATVFRPGGDFAWQQSDHSAAVVLADPTRLAAERAVHMVAADIIHALRLERGADTPPIGLRVQISIEPEGLRVAWRFCFLDTDMEPSDA